MRRVGNKRKWHHCIDLAIAGPSGDCGAAIAGPSRVMTWIKTEVVQVAEPVDDYSEKLKDSLKKHSQAHKNG